MFTKKKYKVILLLFMTFAVIFIAFFNGFHATVSTNASDFGVVSLNRYNFNVDSNDVLVFLHIQKTGGTIFGKHLVKDLTIKNPCECVKGVKRCNCRNEEDNVWLISRYSTGWACGLHADWTELKNCVESLFETDGRFKRFYYVTILRDPVRRYLSEWRHVQRGATWLAAELKCNGRSATLEEVPFCFNDEDWGGVTLEEFCSCEHNLANNRQTRMLANLSIVGCYNRSVLNDERQRDSLLLQSAKKNLREMAFFGIIEKQAETQALFEHTFSMRFNVEFEVQNQIAAEVNLTKKEREMVLHNNRLDIELYRYATQLFDARYKRLQEEHNKGLKVLTAESLITSRSEKLDKSKTMTVTNGEKFEPVFSASLSEKRRQHRVAYKTHMGKDSLPTSDHV